MKQHFVVPQTDDSLQSFGVGSVIGGKFKLEEKIGQGSFGMIYKCINMDTQEVFAVKLEKRNQQHSSMVVREIRVMIEMKGEKGFAKMQTYGKDDEFNYVIMSYLGRNIDSLLKKCSGRFSTQTVVNVAEQMITRLECLHNKNLIHRDIKPENYVIGYGSNFTVVHLIDFGLAKYYKDSEGNHIPFIEKKGMIGTARYASINAHLGYEQSRRDDLEALGYVLLYFAKGRLPWQNINADTKEEKYDKIKVMKQQYTLEQLCENLPNEFVLYFKHVKGLQFEEAPNYTMLKKLFAKIILDKKLESVLSTLDWESLPDYRQRKKYQTVAGFISHGKSVPFLPSKQDIKQPKIEEVNLKKAQSNQPINNLNGIDLNGLISTGDKSGGKMDWSGGQKREQSGTNAPHQPNSSYQNPNLGQIKQESARTIPEAKVQIVNDSVDPNEQSQPMSNLNPLSAQYLNVPNQDKVTNTHSVNSVNSGGTSKLNNYLWSESEDVTNEESIKVGDMITKEKQVSNPHTIFQDIRVKSNFLKSQLDLELEDKKIENNNQQKLQKQELPYSFKKGDYQKITTYLGEDIADSVSENDRDIKVFEVKSAFYKNYN